MAQTPKIPLRSEKFSCNGRSVPAAADASGKIIYPDLLIQEAMKGKLFKKSPERSMKEVESRVISERGMRDLFSSVKDENARKSISRISYLSMNFYSIAAQMEAGFLNSKNVVQKSVMDPLLEFVQTLTAIIDHDEAFVDLHRRNEKGQAILAPVSPQPKAFARWALWGYTWDDEVAIDASLAGFCMSSPTAADHATLERAILAARLDPRIKYKVDTTHDHQ